MLVDLQQAQKELNQAVMNWFEYSKRVHFSVWDDALSDKFLQFVRACEDAGAPILSESDYIRAENRLSALEDVL